MSSDTNSRYYSSCKILLPLYEKKVHGNIETFLSKFLRSSENIPGTFYAIFFITEYYAFLSYKVCSLNGLLKYSDYISKNYSIDNNCNTIFNTILIWFFIYIVVSMFLFKLYFLFI